MSARLCPPPPPRPLTNLQLAFSFLPGSILSGVVWEFMAQASNGVSSRGFDVSGAGEVSAPPFKFMRTGDSLPPPDPVPS